MNFEQMIPIVATISHPAYQVRQTISNLFLMDVYNNESQRDIALEKGIINMPISIEFSRLIKLTQ